jgi:hypothetical protein
LQAQSAPEPAQRRHERTPPCTPCVVCGPPPVPSRHDAL